MLSQTGSMTMIMMESMAHMGVDVEIFALIWTGHFVL